MIKRNEYLNFHSKALYDIGQEKGISFYINENEKNKIIIKTATNSWFLSGKNLDLNNPQSLKNAFIERYSLDYYEVRQVREEYFKKVFESPEDIKEYFIKNSNNLMGEYSLSSIINNVKLLKNNDIENILTKGSLTLGEFNSSLFIQLISKIKDIPNIEKSILAYLKKNERGLDKEWERLKIRESLEEIFPKKLSEFKELNFINEYIENKSKENKTFVEDSVDKTIHLAIDFNAIQIKYPISGFLAESFNGILKALTDNLMQEKTRLGLEGIYTKEIYAEKKYQFTNLFFNLNQNSFLNKEKVKVLLEECFEHLHSLNFKHDPAFKSKQAIKPWLEQKIISLKLDEQDEVQPIKKNKVKIKI